MNYSSRSRLSKCEFFKSAHPLIKALPIFFTIALLTYITEAAPIINTVDSTGGGYPSLVLDESGNPVISYLKGGWHPADKSLMIAHCNDPNCAGGDEIIRPIGSGGLYPSMVLDSSGNPMISHVDETVQHNSTIKLVHCSDPNCVSSPSFQLDSYGGGNGYFGSNSLALDSLGNPVVFFSGGGETKLIHCNDPNCAGGDESIEILAGGSDLSLVLDGAGNPVMSFRASGLKLIHCNDPNCSGGDESLETIDGNSEAGRNNSLVLDSSGYPVISYIDETNADLKLAHCDDPNCAGGNEFISILDDSTNRTSLALDGVGNPIISYIDMDDGYLKLAHCNDPNCVGGDEIIRTVDDGGLSPSLVLDSSGNPVISYSREGLKLVHCDTSSCDAPEIDVQGNGISILNGDVSPSITDNTDFGHVDVDGGVVMHSYVIQNVGSMDLILTESPHITISGTHAADFTLTSDATSPIAPGEQTTFEITFDPGSPGGIRKATINIANNDAVQDPFDFFIQGTGVAPYQIYFPIILRGCPALGLWETVPSGNCPNVSFTVTSTDGTCRIQNVSLTYRPSSPGPFIILPCETLNPSCSIVGQSIECQTEYFWSYPIMGYLNMEGEFTSETIAEGRYDGCDYYGCFGSEWTAQHISP